MNYNQYDKLGKIVRSQGIQGDLIVELYDGEMDQNIDTVFIDLGDDMDMEDSKVAYNIEKIQKKSNNEAVIKFREVMGRSQTSFLKNKIIYAPSTKYYDKNFVIEGLGKAIAGYSVYDPFENKKIGKILGIRKIYKRGVEKTLLILEYENQEIPVPLDDNTIKSINHKTKEVTFSMPIELLEVFLSTK